MGARADRTNRVLLALLGLLLLAGGIAVLVFGSGLAGSDYTERRLLADDFVEFVEEQAGWLWPAVAVVGVLLALLALAWLVMQLRSDRLDDLDLTRRRNDGETHLQAAALTDALVDAVESCPGVRDASARLIEVKGREQLLVHVWLADRADLASAREALGAGPLAELRQVLGAQDCPPVRVELEPTRKGDGRVLA